jgi:hypothetical protein
VQTAGRLDSNPLPWDDEVLLYLWVTPASQLVIKLKACCYYF